MGEPEDQIAALMALLRDRSQDDSYHGRYPLRYRAVGGLVALGAAAVEPLCLALKDGDDLTRRFAAGALARTGDTRAAPPLIAAFQESWEYVQRHVAWALAQIGDARAVAPLLDALASPRIATEALHALHRVLERAA